MTHPFYPRSLVWLRRDLRLSDNVALAAAAEHSRELVLAFNVDPVLLRGSRIGAPIVQTFFDALGALREDLRARGSDLAIVEGDPLQTIPKLARTLGVAAVFFNQDYDPAAIARDESVGAALRECGLDVHASLDHVAFAADVYKVYTPFARRWRERYAADPPLPVVARDLNARWLTAAEIGETRPVPVPEAFGFASSDAFPPCSEAVAHAMLDAFLAPSGPGERYGAQRDFPAVEGTSRLSVQLRAGTIGIRTCFARGIAAGCDKWVSELIWREFYQMILREFPHVDGAPFIEAASALPWENDEQSFARWCEGTTGYPIVDAAMRQLNATGWMHNRLRMIVASFLTKDLLIDWRWGERYFEQRLADADLAQNNGGWQWAASTGTDAAPYFRIFNPVLQSKKFDPDGAFIRRMIPELRDLTGDAIHAPWEAGLLANGYPPPIVDHHAARERALSVYAPVLGKNAPHASGEATRNARPR